MIRLIISFFLLVTFSYKAFSQDKEALSQLSSFLVMNYALPESLKSDCNYNYLAMILESNAKGEITSIRSINDAHEDLKQSFNYLMRFKFKAPGKFSQRPILLFATIDQQNTDACPDRFPYEMSPSRVTEELIEIIRIQLKKEPRTIIQGVFSAESPAPPVR